MPATPISLVERDQRFTFGPTNWQEADRYDNCPAHLAINKSIQKMEGVDFVVRARGGASPTLLLVEAKDYRVGGAPTHKELAKEIARKVAGTLVGIASASRAQQAGLEWAAAGRSVHDHSKGLLVALHMESATWGGSVAVAKAELGVLAEVLQKELAWLSGCRVVAACELVPVVPDCVVRPVP